MEDKNHKAENSVESDEPTCVDEDQTEASISTLAMAESESIVEAIGAQDDLAGATIVEGPNSEATAADMKSRKPVLIAAIAVVVVVIVLALVYFLMFSPGAKYNNAQRLLDSKDYSSAISAFSEISDYQDSADKIKECKFKQFAAYAEEKGKLTASVGNTMPGTVTVSAYGSDGISVDYSQTTSISNVKLTANYTMPVNFGESAATVSGTTKLTMGLLQNGGTYTNELALDISSYTKSSDIHLNWSKSTFVGNKESLVKSFNTPSLFLDEMIEGLSKIVESSGLDVTMNDLGFTSY